MDMDISKFAPKLRQIELFRAFDESELARIISEISEVHLPQGAYLFKEGEKGSDMFYIEEGEVEVLKRSPSLNEETPLISIRQGNIVGEMALINQGIREASIRALIPAKLLKISLKTNESDPVTHQFKAHLSIDMSQKLKLENEKLANQIVENKEHTQARSGLTNLVVHLIGLIFLYIYVIKFINVLDIHVVSSTLISTPILALFALSMFIVIKTSGYPLSLYGFTWKGKTSVIMESLLLCIPLFAIVLISKWIAIHFFPEFRDLKFFHISPAEASGAPPVSAVTFAVLVLLYGAFVPIQEFIFRGVIQSSLEKFLTGKHKTLQAILISNLPFSMIHLHLSLSLAVLVFFYGVFWGWMYARQRTLIGCTLNHFLVGLWAFFIVGIQDFLVV